MKCQKCYGLEKALGWILIVLLLSFSLVLAEENSTTTVSTTTTTNSSTTTTIESTTTVNTTSTTTTVETTTTIEENQTEENQTDNQTTSTTTTTTIDHNQTTTITTTTTTEELISTYVSFDYESEIDEGEYSLIKVSYKYYNGTVEGASGTIKYDGEIHQLEFNESTRTYDYLFSEVEGSYDFFINISKGGFEPQYLNGTIIVNKLPLQYTGLPLENSKKGILKWLY